MSKTRINLSIDVDTLERLRQYAWENHATVSKAVTDLEEMNKFQADELNQLFM